MRPDGQNRCSALAVATVGFLVDRIAVEAGRPMRNQWVRWVAVTAAGAVGGGINAWLIFMEWPVDIPASHTPTFDWSIVPAGAAHGAILALVPFLLASVFRRSRLGWRLLSVPVAGWVGGWLAWAALFILWSDGIGSWDALLWPSGEFGWWGPFPYHGMVSALVALGLALFPHSTRGTTAIGLSVASGILGSLWFWIDIEPWWFACLHGAIWGVLVGVAWSSTGLRAEVQAVGRPA